MDRTKHGIICEHAAFDNSTLSSSRYLHHVGDLSIQDDFKFWKHVCNIRSVHLLSPAHLRVRAAGRE